MVDDAPEKGAVNAQRFINEVLIDIGESQLVRAGAGQANAQFFTGNVPRRRGEL